MGSSAGLEEPKGIDASVGGLVWVRRRNGSWWPGRIMGLDELSEGCLVSPRSGTPVKLLGREDASVDWYNLEKSKRVKAFRCGEYDECIEKAKASAANSNKKAVKYARREDAILHALEIESARLGKSRPDFCSKTDNSSGEHGNSPGESPTMSRSDNEVENEDEDTSDEVSNSEDNSNSALELSQSGISFEEPNNLIAFKVQSMNGRRRRTPNDSEDDGTEGIKRMRGLEDLGMGVVSKRKAPGGLADLAQLDSAFLCDSNNANCVSNGSPVNGCKTYSSSLKRKRSQSSNVHEFLKKKHRRRPLTKVLESTAMVSVPVTCDQLASVSVSPLRDSKLSGLESNESKRSVPPAINNTESTAVSCENGVSLNAFKHPPDVSHDRNKTKENENSGMSGLPENGSSDVLFDVPLVGDDKHSAGFSPMIVPSSSGKPENSQVDPSSNRNEGLNEAVSTDSADLNLNNIRQPMEKSASKWQSKGKRNSRHASKSQKQDSRTKPDVDDGAHIPRDSEQKVDSNDGDGSRLVSGEQADGFPDWSRTAEKKSTPQRSLPYRHSRFTVNSRYQTSDFLTRTSFSPDSQLYDVNLEVKASYRPQHVPLVSLMSKLNGKAIVGHPLTVEALDDGSSNLLSSSFTNPKDDLEGGGDIAVKPKSNGARLHIKHLKSKRKSGFLSKKTRKLSSLTGSHKQSEERKPVVDKLKGPVIACIPLKLVFSRINEALTRPTHRASTLSNP